MHVCLCAHIHDWNGDTICLNETTWPLLEYSKLQQKAEHFCRHRTLGSYFYVYASLPHEYLVVLGSDFDHRPMTQATMVTG